MKTIPLGSRKYPGHVALVDDADYELVSQYNWCVSHTCRVFYAVRRAGGPGPLGGRLISMHGFLTGWPQIDHINHDGLDNRRCNLREATKSQNAWNARGNLNTSSSYKGVHWYKRDATWEAKIKTDGRIRFLGRFANEEDAARAYDAAALAAWGEFAYLNFPPPS